MRDIACVCRSGGRYTPLWVSRLRHGVSQHLRTPHRFTVLTDLPAKDFPQCHVVPLIHDWPGWWAKVELFRPEVFSGPVTYFDLDTLVVGPLDELVTWEHRFTMTHEFYRPGRFCSTAMSWEGDFSFAYRNFKEDPRTIMASYAHGGAAVALEGRIGDQAYLEDQMAAYGVPIATYEETIHPLAVSSFKVSARKGPPPEASVVAFHGRPKMDEPSAGWAYETWRAL